VEEQEVIRVARARANEMMASAQAKSDELKRLAGKYADDVLRTTEETVTAAMNQVHAQRAAFRSVAGGVLPQAQPAQASSRAPEARITTLSSKELRE